MDGLMETTRIFKALSDKNRLRILRMLESRPLCVCEITDVLGLAASTVSKHLSILRDAGFIFERKENKWVNYYLNRTSGDKRIRDILQHARIWIPEDDTVIKDRTKAETSDRGEICGR